MPSAELRDLVPEAFADALEQSAFVTPEPQEGGERPSDAVLASMNVRFGGQWHTLELAAPRAFGRLLAANILAVDEAAPEAEQAADDALRELMNTTCGTLARRGREAASDDADGPAQLALPSVAPLPDPAAWDAMAADPATIAFDAEGHPVLIRLRRAA